MNDDWPGFTKEEWLEIYAQLSDEELALIERAVADAELVVA